MLFGTSATARVQHRERAQAELTLETVNEQLTMLRASFPASHVDDQTIAHAVRQKFHPGDVVRWSVASADASHLIVEVTAVIGLHKLAERWRGSEHSAATAAPGSNGHRMSTRSKRSAVVMIA